MKENLFELCKEYVKHVIWELAMMDTGWMGMYYFEQQRDKLHGKIASLLGVDYDDITPILNNIDSFYRIPRTFDSIEEANDYINKHADMIVKKLLEKLKGVER